MIPLTDVNVHATNDWQSEIRQMIRTPEALLAAVGLGEEWLPAAQAASKLFPVRVTPSFVAKMRQGDPNDPLLRQVMPLAEELSSPADFIDDPLNEEAYNVERGILHKYHNRILTVTTSACAIHCRYCFRRHFPYQDNSQSRAQWQQSLAYLADHPEIDEVVLSGGDPLMLTNSALASLLTEIDQYPNVKRIRFHSRMPIVTPSRIDDELLQILASKVQSIIFVVHSNHANEICKYVGHAAKLLITNGVRLYNQAVLMRGVNDSARSLRRLSEELFAIGIQPYYLHLMDRVKGAAHFEVPESEAIQIHQDLRASTSGYLVPQLAREIAGEPSKTIVASSG
ncbi:EF-P beta-lysylation protein EpmB [Salinibius halmophilus]|uniref:EF-P beta-lysylation protein EpmB n=1 Tax=Salinibius halmophilus TaxID=1853216 RepID=UPI000E66AC80|nr:EF-P beta-lysylation protein EpmB [Salinibius halmophilus]